MTGLSLPSLSLHRLRRPARRLARSVRATVLIEMAFSIPLLVLLGFGGLEIANLTLVHTRISQIGLNTADNASRIAAGSNLAQPQIRESDVNEVFTGVEKQSGGLDFKSRGRIILSSLEQNKEGGQWIHWQRCYGNMKVASAFGPEGKGVTGTDFKGMGPKDHEVTAVSGTAVMFVEVVYQYKPLLYGKWLGPKTIRSAAAFNIREPRDLTKIYPSTGVTASTCTT